MKTQQGIRFEDELLAELKRQAKTQGVTLTKFITSNLKDAVTCKKCGTFTDKSELDINGKFGSNLWIRICDKCSDENTRTFNDRK